MRVHRRWGWSDTRQELGQLVWAILLIDLIAVGLGALASRSMGPFALKVGIGLAVFITVCFAVIIGGNLAIEAIAHRWMSRNSKPPASP
jgi:hypothetical protein